jgi:hypothetical protein
MFRITQDPSSGSIDLYLIKTTRNGSTVLVVCCDAARTQTTGPEYAANHRQRTQQGQLYHCM